MQQLSVKLSDVERPNVSEKCGEEVSLLGISQALVESELKSGG